MSAAPSVTADSRAPEMAGLSGDELALLTKQLDGLRLFWRRRRATPEGERPAVCGAFAVVDYGVLPCARPAGHVGPHVCAGAHGPIEWTPSVPIADCATCRDLAAAGTDWDACRRDHAAGHGAEGGR